MNNSDSGVVFWLAVTILSLLAVAYFAYRLVAL